MVVEHKSQLEEFQEKLLQAEQKMVLLQNNLYEKEAALKRVTDQLGNEVEDLCNFLACVSLIWYLCTTVRW